MKKLILACLFIAGTFAFAQAQDYKSAVGLRFGYPSSITYKSFISETNAFEVYGGFRGFAGFSTIELNGAYLIHAELGDTDGLKYYYGAGVGASFYSYDTGFIGDGSTSFNISGYLGLEYTLSDLPLTLSVDWSPTFLLGGYNRGLGADGGGLAIRYVLGRD